MHSACIDSVSTDLDNAEDAPRLFQELLEESVNKSFDRCYGVSMTIHDELNNIHWSGAAGFDSHTKTDSLSNSQPFRIASVSKTFVATAILRLHEKGMINVDDPILSLIHI